MIDPELKSQIDRLQKSDKERIVIALDGRCAAGKSTLAEELSSLYNCNVFHMDDFFLRPEMRTKERLFVPGENVDHERFLHEILKPLCEGGPVTYQRFNCHSLSLEEPVKVSPKRLNIVEGVYSLHPELAGYFDLTVFCDISKEEQENRIKKRNSPEMAERFFNTWIPLEEKYFEALGIRKKADLILG